MPKIIKRVIVDLEIQYNPGYDVDEMLNDMEYNFESNTKGVEIINSEIIDIDTVINRNVNG